MDLPPQRSAGLARLQEFLPHAAAYARTRNEDRGPEDRSNVSLLSPYLRHRLLSEAEVCAAVLARFPHARVEKFVQEVVWRTYWKGWLEMRPQVWADYLDARDRDARDWEDHDSYRRALDGETGIGCFDAWVAELRRHHYLHNHARMWFASIWIFTLRLPWTLGADLFLRELYDGDAASNTLGWRWVAGLQTPGKHYLARAENIRRYTRGRFHPADQLVEDAPTPSGVERPARTDLPLPPAPPPLAGNPRRGLLLTTDDLGLGRLLAHGAAEAPWTAVAGARPEEREEESRVPEVAAVREYRRQALADALPASGPATDHLGPARPEDAVAWAQRARLEEIWLPYAPVGPTAPGVAGIREALREAGYRVVPFCRQWDRLLWPHARAGFFRFRQSIEPLLDEAIATEEEAFAAAP